MDYFKEKLERTDVALTELSQNSDFEELERLEATGSLRSEKRVKLKRFQAKHKALETEKLYWMDCIRGAASEVVRSTEATPSSCSQMICQGQQALVAALSCLKFLDAIAYKLTEYYDFDLKDPSYVSLQDVIDAVDNWKWDFRVRFGERVTHKSPHQILSPDEERSKELWNCLRSLNQKTQKVLHDKCLLKNAESGARWLALPQNDYSIDRVQDVQEIGLAIGLIENRTDLQILSMADIFS